MYMCHVLPWQYQLGVVSHYRDPQLQIDKKIAYICTIWIQIATLQI